MPTLGCFKAKLRKQEKEAQEDVYVVQNLQTPLLGKPAITALGLAVRVDSVARENAEPKKTFPNLFHGLGKLTSI